LGLTIAHMIAQVHGATLQFDNRPQGGLRLSILLPQ
jgi:signal transduction histidine kinase